MPLERLPNKTISSNISVEILIKCRYTRNSKYICPYILYGLEDEGLGPKRCERKWKDERQGRYK